MQEAMESDSKTIEMCDTGDGERQLNDAGWWWWCLFGALLAREHVCKAAVCVELYTRKPNVESVF